MEALLVRRDYSLGLTTGLLQRCCRANTDLTPKQLSTADAVLDKTWMHSDIFLKQNTASLLAYHYQSA